MRQDLTPEVEELLPDVPVGGHCRAPFDCRFLARCWPAPPIHAIDTLYRPIVARRAEFEEGATGRSATSRAMSS